MTIEIGYLLPTREGVMEDRHAARPVVDLAVAAEEAGLDSVWLGDSVSGKPRHDPLTMMAAIAARTERVAIGTAVLLPILRNPVVLAQQLATVDQLSEGRLIVGIGIGQDIPAVRAEFDAVGVPFDKRVGRMMEGIGLWRALWGGGSVNHTGLWTLNDITIGPKPYSKGGPPIWASGSVPAALKRCARHFDGWFPSGPSDSAVWGHQFDELKGYVSEAGRERDDVVGAAYLTLAIDNDAARANTDLDSYLSRYYKAPAAAIRKYQGCYAGDHDGAVDWLKGFVARGARHLCLRIIGDHARNITTAVEIKKSLG